MQNTIGKNTYPQAVGYNHLIAIPFTPVTLAASQASTAIQARIPLGLNVKIMAVSYVLGGTPAGTLAMNVVSGSAAYETSGSAPFGTATFAGTWAVNETFAISINNVSHTFTVNSNTAGNNSYIAANTAEVINRRAYYGPAFYAYAVRGILYIVNLAYSTAGNSFAFTRTVSSAAGTLTLSGATFSGGTAGTLPVMPVLANSPLPIQGQHVPPLAATNTALFPVDLPINMSAASMTGVLYPTVPLNFEAIWPSASELTLRIVTNGAAAGTLQVILWAVPFDANPFSPQKKVTYFTPAWDIL